MSSSSDLVIDEEIDKQVHLRRNPERVFGDNGNLHIFQQICSDIAQNDFFTIMADECTDVSNKEQFVIRICWVDNTLTAHEDVGLYNVGTIDACSLFSTIEDVLLRTNLTVAQCRGQCYDGASNMVGCR